ncbi:MAG: hypothetical protein IMHGJWDQ_001870 [Candidatus Fervidibacter sp.]
MGKFIRTEEVPNCPLCNQPGSPLYEQVSDRLYDVPGSWSFSYCGHCHLAWLNPRPVLEDIPKCYPDAYFTHEPVESVDFLSLNPTSRISTFKRRLRIAVLREQFGYRHLEPQLRLFCMLGKVAMLVPLLRQRLTMGLGAMLRPWKEHGRLLDIGCGNGSYLAMMKRLGWEVVGTEIDPKAADIATSSLGIFVHVGDLKDAPFEHASFDVITMSHVIEHVADPIDFLRTAARFLKPGGEMIVVTPNLSSLGSRIFGADWYCLDPPRHLYLFTPASVRLLFTKLRLFGHLDVHTISRKGQKIFRKWALVRKTGYFKSEHEPILTHSLQWRLGAWLFGLIEGAGTWIAEWGEEIECVAVKA